MKDFLARLKGWRTVAAAAVLGTIDILDATDLTAIIPEAWRPYWMVLHPVVFLYLRLITNGPVGTKLIATAP